MATKRKQHNEQGRDWVTRSLGCTAAIVIMYMLFLQLLSLKTVGTIQSQALGVSSEFNQLIGLLIVIVEVLALPYLLTVSKSSIIRFLCAMAAVSVFLYWMTIGIITVISNEIINVGLLGGTLPLPGGVWFMTFMGGMLGIVLLYEVLVQKWHIAPLEKSTAK